MYGSVDASCAAALTAIIPIDSKAAVHMRTPNLDISPLAMNADFRPHTAAFAA